MDFLIRAPQVGDIRFQLYREEAPATAAAFLETLPFSRLFYHARVSGREIWIDDAPLLDIPQENASVFARPGEIVIGPKGPARNKIVGCIGIFYGEGQLLDCGNIFGKVFDEDLPKLADLGDAIWRQGARELQFTQKAGPQ
ncbi:MAG TPA: DUF3830 family protein [Flavilitoribacter sp.]|nr:DUF3830 family protein [Flavilitoribacter sp.]HMQ87125.1 DUF3830 family protein [Flavilitoribacter sp.]